MRNPWEHLRELIAAEPTGYQQRLARLSETSASNLSHIVAGRRPSGELAYQLEQLTGIPMQSWWEHPPTPRPPAQDDAPPPPSTPATVTEQGLLT